MCPIRARLLDVLSTRSRDDNGEEAHPMRGFAGPCCFVFNCQQALSRKEKYRKNWKKAKAKFQRIYARVANVRLDFLHKTSSIISKNHATVVVEDLQISNMSRCAAGTAGRPGKKVQQKTGLNRAILDSGWGEFRRQLEYKLLWSGGLFIPVRPPQITSITCPRCGNASKENRKTRLAGVV
jgi:putative transposase